MHRFENRVAVITGGAGGIGKAAAARLLEEGASVVLSSRRREVLDAARHELDADERIALVAGDVSSPAAAERLVETALERFGGVDVLVNNAGYGIAGAFDTSDETSQLGMIDLNVRALVELTHAFWPQMLKRRRGGVLNVASTAAFQPLPGQAAYAAAKAFVLSYGRATGAELRGKGVTLTTLCPGPVETEFAEAAGFDPDDAESALPKFMWVPAPEVALAALDGLEHGRPVVIPGISNRLAARFAQFTPRRVLMPMLAKQHPSLKE
jgi:hypothetical protein